MKLCKYSGPNHAEKPCPFCWPLLRYPQPLSPLDAENVMRDLAYERKWVGFALALAEHMKEHYRRLRNEYIAEGWEREELIAKLAYWRGVWSALLAVCPRPREKRLATKEAA